MNRIFALSLCALLGAGCTAATEPKPLASDHPASLDAASGTMPEPSQTLSNAEPVKSESAGASTSGGQPSEHSGMSGMNHEAPAEQAASAALYVCPMHPEVTSATPGKCPKCGMTLVKNTKNGGHDGH